MASSLIVRSSLNFFSAYQPAAKNSMHLQFTFTPHLQHFLSNRRRICNHVEHLQWSFFAKIVDVLRSQVVGYFCERAPSWIFDGILNATLATRRRFEKNLSITGVTQGNLGLTLPPNSLDLHQTQNQKMKSWTDHTSSFHFPETVQVFSNPTPITQSIIYPQQNKTQPPLA